MKQKKTKTQWMRIGALISLFFFCVFSSNPVLFALPQNPEVIRGQVAFERPNESTLNITASNKAIINYGAFGIGSGETVQFFQPSAHSTVLNRVLGADASSILGNLYGNGRVFLVNPNGIFF